MMIVLVTNGINWIIRVRWNIQEVMEVVGKLYRRLIAAVSGDPKGIQRPTGGHLVSLNWTMSNIYDMKEGDRWWAASDLGWVVGHSYICYAPLLAGLTSVGQFLSIFSVSQTYT